MRSAVIVCAGKSFNAEDWPRLLELGDCLVINFSAYPIVNRWPDLLPHYYLNMDDPPKFHVPWHENPKIRSLLAISRLGRYATRWPNVQTLQWPGWLSSWAALKPDFKAKHKEKEWNQKRRDQRRKYRGVNPFRDCLCPMPYKSVLYAARYLTCSGYSNVYFYGCDFIPDQQQWYVNSVAPLTDKSFKGKSASNEEQLNTLLAWYPHALEQNCQWYSLSPISRLNTVIPYTTY